MSEIIYRKINENELNTEIFSNFNRYQQVNKCWRKRNGQWTLENIAFTEQWGKEEYEFLVECLKNTLNTGGAVIGAFIEGKLAGFTSVENQFFGSKSQYLQLSSIHVSYESRGKGIGKKLFQMIAQEARDLDAKKLYISAHSSEESQAFYKAIGCIDAKEYNEKLVQAEPCDCQLEYIL